MKTYLIYNSEEPILNNVVRKIKGKKMIIFSKKLEDISQFAPDTVFCRNNIEISEKCIEKNINCVNIVSEDKFKLKKQSKFLSQILIKLFNLDEVRSLEGNSSVSYSMLEEVSSQIANNFKSGFYNMINPGIITSNQILSFYNLETQTEKGNFDSYLKGNWEFGLSPIEDFFTESFEKKVNIYLPTYYRFEKTKESIESILKDIEKSQYDVKVYIGDNNTKDSEMKDWLSSLRSEKVEVYFSKKNIGKGMIVNHLYRNSRKCDYLFSIDSDMKVETENFVDSMLFYLTRIQNCGLVSSEQTGLSQHWWNRGVVKDTREGFQVGYSPQGVGVAGGCLCLRKIDWEAVGMYKENHDIYTGDDGILCHNIQNKLGKDVLISCDCKLFHPPPVKEEEDYAKWKMESWQRDQLKFLKEDYVGSNKKGFYD